MLCVLLVAVTHFPNAATDAAIFVQHKYIKRRVIGSMVLVLLYIFVVAGAGYGEAPTLDFVA